MKQLSFGEVNVDQEIPSLEIKLDIITLIRYSAATWNFYLLHLEKEFAQKSGFKDINTHAPFYGAIISTMLNNWTGDPGTLKKQTYVAKKMSYPGDTLNLKGKVVDKYKSQAENLLQCETWATNQNDNLIVSGSAIIVLPAE